MGSSEQGGEQARYNAMNVRSTRPPLTQSCALRREDSLTFITSTFWKKEFVTLRWPTSFCFAPLVIGLSTCDCRALGIRSLREAF
jgi:hypothetical protein